LSHLINPLVGNDGKRRWVVEDVVMFVLTPKTEINVA
jgi:hypothetical protein